MIESAYPITSTGIRIVAIEPQFCDIVNLHEQAKRFAEMNGSRVLIGALFSLLMLTDCIIKVHIIHRVVAQYAD